jgi:hypothetical protein
MPKPQARQKVFQYTAIAPQIAPHGTKKPVATDGLFETSIVFNRYLLDQHHLFGLDKRACLQPVEVRTARQTRRIERGLMCACWFNIIHQIRDDSAQHIKNLQPNLCHTLLAHASTCGRKRAESVFCRYFILLMGNLLLFWNLIDIQPSPVCFPKSKFGISVSDKQSPFE